MDAARLRRALLALPELPIRRQWLEDRLSSTDLALAAPALDRLLQQAEARDAAAQGAIAPLVLLLVGPTGPHWRERLALHATRDGLSYLERILRVDPRPRIAVAEPDELPVPDYGAGRELTLGERRSLARRPTRRSFERLLKDPHPMVIELLLTNPQLTERDVLRLATARPARPHLIRKIVESPRWFCRSSVRLAVILNPGSPGDTSTPLLALCNSTELKEVHRAQNLSPLLRVAAFELLERRPPMSPGGRTTEPLQ